LHGQIAKEKGLASSMTLEKAQAETSGAKASGNG
jgi:hypothetical protein